MPKFTPIDLGGAVVAVSGAARGIGFAIASLFVQQGARVAIGDLTLEAAQAAAAQLGPRASAYAVNVGDKASYQRWIDDVEKEVGPIDVLVNNAGIMPVGGLLEESDEVAFGTFNVNYWAHYYGFKIVAPRMVARGRGHIVNITSAAGKIHSGGLASYVASKHAATGLARSFREELLGSGVSVSAVLPAAIKTQLVDGIRANFLERIIFLPPALVARTVLLTLKRRPALIGAPPGLVSLMALIPFIPERLWLLGRKAIQWDSRMSGVDREKRAEYDGRIAAQTVSSADGTAKL
ncbi:SDR family NAD(P)-dependent oxidoreductase [Segniliparus rugosus]|uniref:Short-chain dehydrogenase n=1 Tax=Segniliparus rugosus (strain ATCC BAA-974 / DSM 45345 / CCUG 50838 / CIP 108380 / JCM 13579 / CDC 945) TaxID=679197 RepID=E5XR73_SEGRC|nr:SDR family NAD(P)-dependent oxidoreductase [Segniliparus rugosus]EFV13166.1 hypothetical protein HMPREF9336_01995 [Segniliparus rugosus ATCC BAA-974]